MTERPLDLDAVEAFVRIAELDSFTRAAEAMRTTQAAVSLKLKRLEQRLGCRLVERTPRYVQLTAQGAAFLEHARELLDVHERALAVFAGARQRLTIGISDHVAGPELAGGPLPLATLAGPCGVRAMAGQRLDAAGVPWTEIFVGGGVAAVAAAVMAGLGVAALAPRMLPFGAVDVGPKLGLPELPG